MKTNLLSLILLTTFSAFAGDTAALFEAIEATRIPLVAAAIAIAVPSARIATPTKTKIAKTAAVVKTWKNTNSARSNRNKHQNFSGRGFYGASNRK